MYLHLIQIKETKDYQDDDLDLAGADHIKVHIVDLQAVIQQMFANPRTKWDKVKPGDDFRSFSKTPFAQACYYINIINNKYIIILNQQLVIYTVILVVLTFLTNI